MDAMVATLDAPLVVKPHTIRDIGPVDVQRFKALVSRISEELWNGEDAEKENNFFCFQHTRHIVFRFIGGNRDHRQSYSNPIWQAWQGMLLPIMMETIKPYGFEDPQFPKVMLARLEAGQVIDRHVDGAGSNLHVHKIHIPLHTNDKALFFVGDESFHLQEGRSYEVNNIRSHGVENMGDEDRIHFIFEVFEGKGSA